jgi:hypothetical protein
MSQKEPRTAVIAKALADPAFRAALLKDPKSAVEQATGVKVPPGVSIKVVEDTASVVHLVLPPASASRSLSEAQLAQVAGGADATRIECAFNTEKPNANFCTTVIVK